MTKTRVALPGLGASLLTMGTIWFGNKAVEQATELMNTVVHTRSAEAFVASFLFALGALAAAWWALSLLLASAVNALDTRSHMRHHLESIFRRIAPRALRGVVVATTGAGLILSGTPAQAAIAQSTNPAAQTQINTTLSRNPTETDAPDISLTLGSPVTSPERDLQISESAASATSEHTPEGQPDSGNRATPPESLQDAQQPARKEDLKAGLLQAENQPSPSPETSEPQANPTPEVSTVSTPQKTDAHPHVTSDGEPSETTSDVTTGGLLDTPEPFTSSSSPRSTDEDIATQSAPLINEPTEPRQSQPSPTHVTTLDRTEHTELSKGLRTDTDRAVQLADARSTTETTQQRNLEPKAAKHGSQQSQRQEVVVQRGDSLWTIAQASLPLDATAQEIARLVERIHTENFTVIGKNPNLILPGQTLSVPFLD